MRQPNLSPAPLSIPRLYRSAKKLRVESGPLMKLGTSSNAPVQPSLSFLPSGQDKNAMIERANETEPLATRYNSIHTQQQAHLRIEHQMCSVLQAVQTPTYRVYPSKQSDKYFPPAPPLRLPNGIILTATDLMTIITVSE